jgi:hypothetical protein
MQIRIIITLFALLVSAMPAMAQDAGGLAIAPQFIAQGAIKGLARPLFSANTPFLTARDVQNGMTAADRQAKNQTMISKIRGDAGFLGGFQFGQPLAASRQLPVQDQSFGFEGGFHQRHRHGPQPIIINNEGPLAITNGNGNLVQQQSSVGALGPVAQQQVATTTLGGSGGALNLVTGGGNIIQRTPR